MKIFSITTTHTEYIQIKNFWTSLIWASVQSRDSECINQYQMTMMFDKILFILFLFHLLEISSRTKCNGTKVRHYQRGTSRWLQHKQHSRTYSDIQKIITGNPFIHGTSFFDRQKRPYPKSPFWIFESKSMWNASCAAYFNCTNRPFGIICRLFKGHVRENRCCVVFERI